MPRITKVRLANIHLENGEKIIPHACWELKGRNSVFLLENGGGKTSVIHLLMQVLLPNCKLGTRQLRETLAKNTNGHVLLEWQLDTAEPKYVCTGFSFQNGTKNDSKFDYFMYTWEYKEGGQEVWDIFSAPIIQGSSVTGFHSWDQLLQKNGIKVKRTIKDYKRDLRKYVLFAEEWENIREINGGGEAGKGVETFFQGINTSPKLAEHLLVPAVESILFPNEEGKRDLAEGFIAYQRNLMRLPEHQKTLASLQQLFREFQILEDLWRDRMKQEEGYKEQQQHLARMYHTIIAEFQNVQKDATEILSRCAIEEQALKEICWKEASIKIREVINQKEKTEQQLKSKEIQEETAKKDFDVLRQSVRSKQAMRVYVEQYKPNEESIAGAQLILKQKKSTQSEQIKSWEQAQQVLHRIWTAILRSYQQNLQDAQNQMQETETGKSGAEERLNKAMVVHENAIAKQQEVAIRFQQKKEEERRLESEWSLIWSGWSSASLKAAREVIESKARTIKELKEEQQQIRVRLKECKVAITVKEDNEKTLQVELGRLQEVIDRCESIKQNVLSLFHKEGMWNRDETSSWLVVQEEWKAKIQDVESSWNSSRNARENLDGKISVLEEHPYFVPSETLMEVRQFLEDRRVLVISGSEWLSGHVEEEKRQEWLERYPLLPYSLLIEQSQEREVRSLMEEWKVEIEYPIAFYARQTLGRVVPENYGYIYTGLDATRFGSQEEKEKQLQLLQEKREVEYRKEKEFQKIWEEKKQGFHILQSWYESEQGAQTIALEGVQRLLYQIEQLHKGLEQDRLYIQEQEMKQENIQVQLEDDARDHDLWLRREVELQRLLERYPVTLEERYQEAIQAATESDEQRKLAQKYRQEIEESWQKRWTEQQQAALQVKRWKSLIQTDDVQEVEVDLWDSYTEDEYEHARMERNRIQQVIQGYADDVTAQIRLISQYAEANKRLENNFSQWGVSLSWLQMNSVAVTEEEIEVLEQQLKKVEKHQKSCEKEVREAQKSYHIAYGIWENRYRDFKLEWKELYAGHDTIDEIQYQRKNSEDRLRSLEELLVVNDKEKATLSTLQEKLEEWETEGKISLHKVVPYESYQYNVELLKQDGKKLQQLRQIVRSLQRDWEEKQRGLMTKYENHYEERVRRWVQNWKNHSARYLYDQENMNAFFEKAQQVEEVWTRELEKEVADEKEKQQHLINLVYDRVLSVYRCVMEIPKYAKVNLYGKRRDLFKIKWELPEEIEVKEKIRLFLELLVEETKEKKENGASVDEIHAYTFKQFQTVSILKKIIPLEREHILIFKPKNEEFVDNNALQTWEEASKWSGGEQFVSYMVVFMVLITYIRKKTYQYETWKTIIADNPFGTASSDHIVRPIMELAQACQIQMFCFTALKEEGIRSFFPHVISNRYYSAGGRAILRSEQREMKHLSYHLE